MADDQNRTVRIDKWLWAVRAYKTRSMAADACKSNRILVNGAYAKPGREVRAGDIVGIKKMPVTYSFRVLSAVNNRQPAKDVPLYAENITPQEELDKLLVATTAYVRRDRGTGRPTKKERREIDELAEDIFFSEEDRFFDDNV